MLNVGVLVSGNGTNLQCLIDAVRNKILPVNIAAVISSHFGAYAMERARFNGIPYAVIQKKDYLNQDNYDAALAAYFKSKDVELVVSAGFLRILGPVFLQAFPDRVMNIHPSLIPSFCGMGFYGLRVHRAVLARGVRITGATVHFWNEEPDAGPIILQKAVAVREGDTPETLQERVMAEAERVILPEAVRLFAENRLTVKDGKVHVAEEVVF